MHQWLFPWGESHTKDSRDLFFSMALAHGVNQTEKWKLVKSNKQARTNMSALVCNGSRAEWKYFRHLNSCGISDNCDSSDSRQEQTCLQGMGTVSLNQPLFQYSQ